MEYIQVGKIVNTHGIKGDLKILPLTQDVKRFEKLERVYIGDDKIEKKIVKVGYSKGNVLLRFQHQENINDVEGYRNYDVWIKQEDKITLPEDSYFLHDILGLEVYLQNQTHIGTITDILQPGANDVYIVKNKDKEYLIPAIKDTIVEVNIEENKMIIDPLEGTLEQ